MPQEAPAKCFRVARHVIPLRSAVHCGGHHACHDRGIPDRLEKNILPIPVLLVPETQSASRRNQIRAFYVPDQIRATGTTERNAEGEFRPPGLLFTCERNLGHTAPPPQYASDRMRAPRDGIRTHQDVGARNVRGSPSAVPTTPRRPSDEPRNRGKTRRLE